MVPAQYRDPEGHWYGVSMRARVVYASKERVKQDAITYEELADPKWKGKICIRSGQHIYNNALFAASSPSTARPRPRNGCAGLKANLAQKPSGGDRETARDVAAGKCDLGIGNTYYWALMNDKEADKKAWADATRVILPTFQGGGTHVNLSGVVLAKHAPNKANAMKLIEWLVGEKAQHMHADLNYEYPVRAGIAVNPTIAGYGPLKPDAMPLAEDRRAQEGGGQPGRQGRLRQLSTTDRRQVRGLAVHARDGQPVRSRRSRRIGASAGSRRSSRSPALAALAAGTARRPRVFVALGDDGELWPHLAAYVLPVATAQTALLLAGVAAMTHRASGVGTAWLVTTFEFPGRDTLVWLLPLPLAIPTYIVAYVYVDLLDALGPVQSALRALVRLALRRRLLVPDVRSLGGADLRHRLRALPLRLSRRARDVPDPERVPDRSRAHARRDAAGRWRATSRCRWRGRRSRSGSRSRCSRRSTTSAPANISACRP